jgi:hypothetical protein
LYWVFLWVKVIKIVRFVNILYGINRLNTTKGSGGQKYAKKWAKRYKNI